MSRLSTKTKTILNISTLVLLFCIDRMSKAWAMHTLETPRVFIDGVLQLNLVYNQRIAFFLDIPAWVSSVIVAAVLFIILFVLVYEYQRQRYMSVAALGLVVIGAFSNLLDRLRHGFVVDFIDVPFWSVFNFADAYIVAGIIVVFFAGYLDKQPQSK